MLGVFLAWKSRSRKNQEKRISKISNITLTGTSGQTYEFAVYPLDSKFVPVGVVYYISERTMTESDKGSHTSLYIGQSGDISTCFEEHHQQDCFTAIGANSIGLHVDSSEQSRREKVRDLVNALQPPCND